MALFLRRIAAVFLVAHGVAHVVGFMASWQLGDPAAMPYSTLILGGNVDVGDLGMRIVGLLWLAGAAASVAAGIALWQGAYRAVAVLVGFSLAVCILGLPAAIIGFWIDIAVLAGLGMLALLRPSALRSVA